jgi:hypothetical protein
LNRSFQFEENLSDLSIKKKLHSINAQNWIWLFRASRVQKLYFTEALHLKPYFIETVFRIPTPSYYWSSRNRIHPEFINSILLCFFENQKALFRTFYKCRSFLGKNIQCRNLYPTLPQKKKFAHNSLLQQNATMIPPTMGDPIHHSTEAD